MLNNYDATVTLATKNMAESRAFYTQILGLKENKTDEEGLAELVSGKTLINLYPAGSANLNGGTVCTWWVGNEFDEIVCSLRQRGVKFERYDGMPDVTRDGDVHTLTKLNRKVVWFKDPSGNFLSLSDQ